MSTAPDHKKLTADEYFKLTENWTERTELWDGVIVYLDRDDSGDPLSMAAPTELHQDIVGGIYAEARSFIRANKGTCKAMMSPFDVVLSDADIVQPDVLVVCDRSKMDGKRCHGGLTG